MGLGQSSYNFIENVMPYAVKFEDLPEIEHQTNFVGPTDYLDGIFPEHLTHYVMRGKDQYKRLYIVIYYKGNIQTYFQRYTGYPDGTWSYGRYLGGNSDDFVIQGCGNIAEQPDNIAKIKEVMIELLENNKITTQKNI